MCLFYTHRNIVLDTKTANMKTEQHIKTRKNVLDKQTTKKLYLFVYGKLVAC